MVYFFIVLLLTAQHRSNISAINFLYLYPRFELSKSVIHEIVTEFMVAVIRTLRSTTWLPATAPASEIPGCVGYIDGRYNKVD